MEFKKPFDRQRVYAHAGDPFHIEYEARYDIDGALILKEVGKTDIYLEIQSHKQSCDINYLIAKYKAGDVNALSRVQGYYTDISDIPDIHTVYNTIKTAEQDFEKLPVEIKEKFENSFERYLFSVGSEEWLAAMNISVESDYITENQEVISDAE